MRMSFRVIASIAFASLATMSVPAASTSAAAVVDTGRDAPDPALAAPSPDEMAKAFTDADAVALDQKAETRDSIADDAVSSDAILAILAGFRVTKIGVVNGDTVIANSQSLIRDAALAVPEPAVWLQLIAGFGLVGLDRRRRRRAAAHWRCDAAGEPRG